MKKVYFTDKEKQYWPMSQRLARLFCSCDWPVDRYPWIAHVWNHDDYNDNDTNPYVGSI